MKTKIFNNRVEAEAYLDKVYPDTAPKETICYKDGFLIWNLWNGNRAFIDTDFQNTGDFRWARNQDVAFNLNSTVSHLGDYWGEMEGFYNKN